MNLEKLKNSGYNRKPLLWFFIIAFLFLGLRAWELFLTPYAFGMDGYYYASQVKSFWEKGRFFSPDSSIILWSMAYFSVLGKDIIVMNKIFVLILNFFFLLGAYRLGKNFGDFESITLSVFFGASSLALRFSFEYIKNYGGLVFLLFFLACLLKEEKKRGDYIVTAVFALGAALSHKLSAGLIPVILALYLAYKKKIYLRKLNHREKRIAFFLTVFFVLPGSLFYFYLPNFLHGSDFIRLPKSFSATPQFAPWSYLKNRNFDLLSILESFLLIVPLGLLAFAKGRRERFFIFGFLPVLWFPFFKFDTMDLAYRFFLLSFIPAGMALVLLPIPSRYRVAVLGCIFALGVWNNRVVAAEKRASVDYGLFARITPLINLPEDSLMIVHQGFDYFYCFYVRKDAYRFPAEKKHEGRPIYRMAYGVPRDTVQKYLGDQKEIQYLPGFYTLMPEPLWQKMINRMEPAERALYQNWRNPYKHRDEFLIRNDRFKKN